jgi:hypothetical protein
VSHAAVLTNLLMPAVHLHLLPKMSVDVHVYVLEGDSDASVLAAGLSAACAALADAGIPLSGLAVGSTVVSVRWRAGISSMTVAKLIPGPPRLFCPPRPLGAGVLEGRRDAHPRRHARARARDEPAHDRRGGPGRSL